MNLRGYAPAPPMRPIDALARFLPCARGAGQQVPAEIEEAAALYRTLLADRRVLVVLDNAGDAEQVRPLLPGSPGCLVLVTSRDRLAGWWPRDGARRWAWTCSPTEAYTLLVRMLGAERAQPNRQAVAELARLCGWLPLALRIAAANLLDQTRPGIAAYTARLRAADRLAALRVDGDPQAAVRAAFDHSYAALTRDARRLFRLLGLVPGPDVTAPAAAALADDRRCRGRPVLDRLAGAHLVEPRRRRPVRPARPAAPVRPPAHRGRGQRTGAADGAGAAARLLSAPAATAAQLLYPTMVRLPLPPASSHRRSRRSPTTVQALVWLDAERSNLVAAVRHAAEHGPHPRRMAAGRRPARLPLAGMHVVDWSAVAEAALAAAEAEGGSRAQSTAAPQPGRPRPMPSRYRQAIEHYSRALALNQQTGWLEGQAATLSKLGVAHARSGRLPQAADYHNHALALNQRIGRLGGQATNLGNLGVVYLEQGRLEAAFDHHAQALALFGKLGYRGSQGTALGWLGEIDHAKGQLDRAVDHANAALAIQREVGDRGGEADTLRTLAGIHRDTGRLGHGFELATTAAALARDTGERRLQADALTTLASVHLHRGSLPQARDNYGQALELARATQSRYPEVVALLGLATTHQHLDHLDQAHSCTQQALTLARQTGYRLLEGQASTTLASIQLAQDQPHRAIQIASQALAIQRDTGHRLGQAHTLLVLGHALHPEGPDAALPHWQQALALFTEIGTPQADHAHALVRTCAANHPIDEQGRHEELVPALLHFVPSAAGDAVEHPTREPVGVNLSSLPSRDRCTRAVHVEADDRPHVADRVTSARAVSIRATAPRRGSARPVRSAWSRAEPVSASVRCGRRLRRGLRTRRFGRCGRCRTCRPC